MKKIKTVLILGLAGLSILAMGCNRSSSSSSSGSGSDKSGKIVIGVVLKTLSSPYWQTVAAGLQDQAKKDGLELILLGPPTEDAVEQQINMVQDVLTQGITVLVFSPSQPQASTKVLQAAKSKNIPVILVDTPMPAGFEDYATFIGTTNDVAGEDAAKEIIRNIPKGTAPVVILEGAPGNPTTTERADGAQRILEQNGFTYIRQPAYSDKNRAMEVMQNIMQGTPDIAAVFGANDDMALGAYRALQQLGKTDTLVLGVDGVNDALDTIINGAKYISLAQRSYGMGALAVESAQKILKGESIPKYIDSGTDMINTIEAAQKQKNFLAGILK